MVSESGEEQPLLQQDREAQHDAEHDYVHNQISWLSRKGDQSDIHTSRREAQRFLTSKIGHYFVLLLVSLDVSGIFADFLINLYVCEHACMQLGDLPDDIKRLGDVQEVLGIVSLVFSCLFVAELLASIWAFGAP